MALLLTALLLRVSLIAVPNGGFYLVNKDMQVPFKVWYNPPKGEMAVRLGALRRLQREIDRLMKKRNKETTQLLQLTVKERFSDAEVDMMRRINKAVSELDNNLVELMQGQVAGREMMAEAFREYLEDLEWPNMLWITIGANVSAGIALFLFWRSDSYFFAPTAALELTMASHWSFYRCLFQFGLYKVSCVHSVLTPLMALITTGLFWKVNRTAAIFLLPYVGTLGYVGAEMLSIGQENAEVRLLAVKKALGLEF